MSIPLLGGFRRGAGFSAYLRPPLDIPNLLLQLDQVLQPSRLPRPRSRAAGHPTGSPAPSWSDAPGDADHRAA
ncbi:MAG: hypothetical protein M3Z04_16745 [Chloroflexota bacterium]|nr:hypothetical protein [Chloroflexota bacterium]